MSFLCVKWCYSKEVLNKNLSLPARAVLLALSYAYYDDIEERRKVKNKPDCYPSVSRLRYYTGYGKTAINEAKNELETRGLIHWTKGSKEKGQYRSNEYIINCPELLEKLLRIRDKPPEIPNSFGYRYNNIILRRPLSLAPYCKTIQKYYERFLTLIDKKDSYGWRKQFIDTFCRATYLNKDGVYELDGSVCLDAALHKLEEQFAKGDGNVFYKPGYVVACLKKACSKLETEVD